MSYPTGDRPPEVLPEVLEALREHNRYSVLISALERTGIVQGLRISPSFTLLAPTDSAFAALNVRPSTLDSYEVAELLRNHVIQKALTVRQLTAISEVENTRGLSLEVGPGASTVGGATLVEPNVAIENGVVHGIDTVLRMDTEGAPTNSPERSHSRRSLRDVVGADGFGPQPPHAGGERRR